MKEDGVRTSAREIPRLLCSSSSTNAAARVSSDGPNGKHPVSAIPRAVIIATYAGPRAHNRIIFLGSRSLPGVGGPFLRYKRQRVAVE